MVTCGQDDGNFSNGSSRRYRDAAPVRLRVPDAVPARRSGGPRLAAHARIRRVRLAGGLALGILVHADRRPVRVVPLHRRDARPGALHRRRAPDGRPVLHVPRLRFVLPRAGGALHPARAAIGHGGRDRRAHDGARRRHRSARGARRSVVPRASVHLRRARDLFWRAVLELRRMGDRRRRRGLSLPGAGVRRLGTAGLARSRVILRRVWIQPRHDDVDRGVAPGRSGCGDARRGRPDHRVHTPEFRRDDAGPGDAKDSARMSVPLSQMLAVSSYVIRQRLAGRKRYPLVLMLEPLFRCNLACAGCGQIQYPAPILRKHLTVERCLAAVDECGAPIVSIPGGEPLMYPDIGRLAEALVARRKYVYLCTNAILLKEKLEAGPFTPSKYFSFSVHLDGLRAEHDEAVCRDGVYVQAVEGIKEALGRGFRVTTNSTLFDGVSPLRMREFFDEMMDLGVEGMMISPGYSYAKAPDQEHFLRAQRSHDLFSAMLSNPKRRWRFNQSPLFLQFLMGKQDFECTPWGNPTFNVFGWQRPCYLLQEGYAASFKELLETTRWENYGRRSGNEKCRDCMVHCGYEPTAVHHTFASWRGFRDTATATVTGRFCRRSRYDEQNRLLRLAA